MSHSIRLLVAILVLVVCGSARGADGPEQLARLDRLLAEGRSQAAAAQARALLAADAVEAPHVWRVRQRLAVALLELDRPREAVAELEAALNDAPGDAALHLNLGRALRRLEHRGRAIAEYGLAVELAPREYLWRLEYAEALLDLRIHRDALREVRQARVICGDCAAALRAEVNVLQASGDLASGREALRLLYGQEPRRDVRRLLAGSLWAAGDTVGTVALLDTVPAEGLSDVELMLLIQGDRHLGRAERALDWVRRDQSLLVDGGHPGHDFWAIAAEICLAADRPHEALAAIDRALAAAGAEPVYHHNRAAILLALGRQDAAEEALATARRLGAATDGER